MAEYRMAEWQNGKLAQSKNDRMAHMKSIPIYLRLQKVNVRMRGSLFLSLAYLHGMLMKNDIMKNDFMIMN